MGLDLSGGSGERLVLESFAEPAGVVAAAEVVIPGRVVDAVGQLQEEREILCAEIEL